MTFPIVGQFGLIDNPLIEPPYFFNDDNGSFTGNSFFLLMDGTNFLLMNGTNFLLMGS